MSSTANLGIGKVDGSLRQPEVPINAAFDAFDRAIAGYLPLDVAGNSDVILDNQASTVPGTQALNQAYGFYGALTGNISVKFPATGGSARQFVVFNNTTGAFTLTVKTTAGGSTGIVVTQGKKRLLWTDGTNVYDSITEGGGSITGAASDLSNLSGPTAINTSLIPGTSGLAVGDGTHPWDALHLKSGGTINFNNGDVLLTHASNKLTISGASTGLEINPISAGVVAGGLYIGAPTSVSRDDSNYSDLLHLQGTDAKITALTLDAYGLGGNEMTGRKATGTFASPTATTNNSVLLQLVGRGYQTSSGAGFTDTNDVMIRLVASEGFTNTARGTRIQFHTTPAGSATVAEVGRFTNVGILKIGGTANRGTTEGVGYLAIFDGTAPVGTLANGVSIYSSGGNLYAMNAAGAATQLTGAAPGSGDALVANPLSQFASTTSAQLAGVLSDETGYISGAKAVFSISPVLTTPDIGVASATRLTINQPPAFDLAAGVLSVGELISPPSSVTVATGKHYAGVRQSQSDGSDTTFILQGTGGATGSATYATIDSTSHASSYYYGHVSVVTNNGPGTARAIYGRAHGGVGGTGNVTAGNFAVRPTATNLGYILQLSGSTNTDGVAWIVSDDYPTAAVFNDGIIFDPTVSIASGGAFLKAFQTVGQDGGFLLYSTPGGSPLFKVDKDGRVSTPSITLAGSTSGTVALAATATGGGLTVGTGPTTLTDAAGKILSAALNTVAVAQGGTGLTAFTAHNVLTGGSAGTALGSVAPGTAGSVLISDGTDWVSSAVRVPQNSRSAAYTTVLGDAGGHIFHPAADTTARTWTIDSNANVAYPIGTTITFINQPSAGVITIVITSDTLTLYPGGSTGSRTLAAGNVATAIKVGTTSWVITGTSGLT